MFGSVNIFQSRWGMKTRGPASASSTWNFRSLSKVMSIFLAQWSHSVLIATDSGSFPNYLCTKGTAIASSAQAAYRLSPVLNVA